MRNLVISAAVFVGFAIAGVTLAQQNGAQKAPSDASATNQVSEKAKLRAKVARVRAEVELLQLEHDVDADLLKKLTTDIRNLEMLKDAKAPMEEVAKALNKTVPAPEAPTPQPALPANDSPTTAP